MGGENSVILLKIKKQLKLKSYHAMIQWFLYKQKKEENYWWKEINVIIKKWNIVKKINY